MREAFHIATTGRPGPGADRPAQGRDQRRRARRRSSDEVDLPGYIVPGRAEPDLLEEGRGAARAEPQAAGALRRPRRGDLGRGQGDHRSSPRSCSAPIVNTLLGKGAVDETHPLHLGMLGMHGTAYANKAVTDCDLIMAIGARWDDRITGKRQRVLHRRDQDPHRHRPGRVQQDHAPRRVASLGDARLVIEDLLPLVEQARHRATGSKQMRRLAQAVPAQVPEAGRPARAARARPAGRADRGRRASSPPTSASTRCGRRSSAARRKNRHWLSSGGAGTMGFGFPAAIGAQFAQPGQEGLGDRRRRRLPDDAVRAGDGGDPQAAGEDA